MTSLPDRRSALGLLASAAAGAALSSVRVAPASAQLLAPPSGTLPIPGGRTSAGGLGGVRISRVAVDASALRTPVNTITADLVTRDLAGDLRILFADRMVGPGDRGTTLVARITSLYLPPWAGGRNDGEGPDNIEGVGILASGNRVVSETPVYTTLLPSYSGPWYDPDIDRLRVASISYQFAYWLRRDMGI